MIVFARGGGLMPISVILPYESSRPYSLLDPCICTWCFNYQLKWHIGLCINYRIWKQNMILLADRRLFFFIKKIHTNLRPCIKNICFQRNTTALTQTLVNFRIDMISPDRIFDHVLISKEWFLFTNICIIFSDCTIQYSKNHRWSVLDNTDSICSVITDIYWKMLILNINIKKCTQFI